MALIEIDGLPNLIAWWIFPWQTVSHNQMVRLMDIMEYPSLYLGLATGWFGVIPYHVTNHR